MHDFRPIFVVRLSLVCHCLYNFPVFIKASNFAGRRSTALNARQQPDDTADTGGIVAQLGSEFSKQAEVLTVPGPNLYPVTKDNTTITPGSITASDGTVLVTFPIDQVKFHEFLFEANQAGGNLAAANAPANFTSADQTFSSWTYENDEFAFVFRCFGQPISASDGWQSLGARAIEQASLVNKTDTGLNTTLNTQIKNTEHECDAITVPAYQDHILPPETPGSNTSATNASSIPTATNPSQTPATNNDGECSTANANGVCLSNIGGRLVKRVPSYPLGGTSLSLTLRSVPNVLVPVGAMAGLAWNLRNTIWAAGGTAETSWDAIVAPLVDPSSQAGALANAVFQVVCEAGARIDQQTLLQFATHVYNFARNKGWETNAGSVRAMGGQLQDETGAVIATWAWGTTAQTIWNLFPPTIGYATGGDQAFCQVVGPDGHINLGCVARTLVGR